jgi:hypothetical protein
VTDHVIPEHLARATREAAHRWETARTASATTTIEPGQVVILPELEEPRLAWAVLTEKREDDRQLLAAADVNTLAGSGDVSVVGPGIGSLTIRCRSALWVDGRRLSAVAPFGSLSAEDLARAEGRWQAIGADRPVGTFSEQETDDDPEYQDWVTDVVEPAVARLAARAGAAEPTPAPVLPYPKHPPAAGEEPRPVRPAPWLRWAAVLAFLALGAGSGLLWWRQGQELAALRAAGAAAEAEHRRAIAELEARRAEIQVEYEDRLKEAGEDRARLEAEYREQLAELETELTRLRRSTEVKNPLLAALDDSSAQRGHRTQLKVGPEVSHLVLLLPVDDPPGTEFQIEVYERRSGKRVYLQKGLTADVLGEVRLGLPAALLPPADYSLRLFRKEGEDLRLVREHTIDIDEEPRRRPRSDARHQG